MDLPSCGSEATNSSHPETPDSCSVKEEPESGLPSAPAQTSWRCLWADCDAPEFLSQRALVDHVNESHMEVKKGYDELPCLWKVRIDGRLVHAWTSKASIASIPLIDLLPGKPICDCVTGLPEEADPLQRQVQTADAHEGAHQGEAVPLRGEWQTANTLVSRNLAPPH